MNKEGPTIRAIAIAGVGSSPLGTAALARAAAAQEHDRMLAELKREVGKLVVQATTTVTGKILTAEDHRRLAEETAKQIAS